MGRKLPDSFKNILNKFFEDCSQSVVNLDRSAIYNMDESSIELDSTSKIINH
jgi:hypothetical protein